MMIEKKETKSPILTAALIALPLSLVGGLAVFLMTQNIGNALTAMVFGLVIGAVIFGLSALGGRKNGAESRY